MALLSVREMQAADIEHIVQYWLSADPAFLQGMGVDLSKMPTQTQWIEMLTQQLSQSYQEKQSYCIVWERDGQPTGHSNVNKIVYGESAYMHLHLWNSAIRQKGMGTEFVKMALPWFFEKLHLKILYCEPYALNPAPNKTLEKIGFNFVQKYRTTPGFLNFEQEVNRWELDAAAFRDLSGYSFDTIPKV
jgi:RimJ/RimL family protein N-acetyltransferase